MQGLPIKYFDTHSHGDIMSMYTNDIDTLRQMISHSQCLRCLIVHMTIVSVFACMVALSIPLTLVNFNYDWCNYTRYQRNLHLYQVSTLFAQQQRY